MLWLGLLSSVAFVGFSVREDRLWKNVAKVILLVLVGWGLMIGDSKTTEDLKYWHVVGVTLIVAAFCVITLLGAWINRQFFGVMAGFGILLVAALFLMPGWLKDYWLLFTKQKEFRLIPLSEMRSEWIGALLGAGVYVVAYGSFQQWRTDGKWLDEVKKKLRGNA